MTTKMHPPSDHKSPLGIFCLEGEWTDDLRVHTSVLPMLEFLAKDDQIRYIHRTFSSPAGFVDYIKRWSQARYKSYSVGYFAFHGNPGALWLGTELVGLGELALAIEGRCKDKIIYFASCSVLNAPRADLQTFRKAIGAKALCGYTHDAYWMPSAIFDMLFMHILNCGTSLKEAEKCMNKACPGIKEHVGFRVIQ